jgi:hypothetical protein
MVRRPCLLRWLVFPGAVGLLQRRPLSSSTPPAAMAPPSAHSLPAPFLPLASKGTAPPAPTLSRGSNSHGRPEIFFQCPVHLPPSSSPCTAPFPHGREPPPFGRHPPLCSSLHVRRQPICAASNNLGELLAVLRFFCCCVRLNGRTSKSCNKLCHARSRVVITPRSSLVGKEPRLMACKCNSDRISARLFALNDLRFVLFTWLVDDVRV